MTGRPAPRLFALLAREAPAAVVFRRGPTNQVLIIAWNTADDTFEPGQWFKGRIYERRCDLSPSGRKLIYFAGNQKPPHRTWTAVSTPPYLTALVLWPNGSTWGGGGSFETERRLYIHQGCRSELAEGFSLPKPIQLIEKSARSNDPLARDGWSPVSHEDGVQTPTRYRYATQYAKPFDLPGRRCELQFSEEYMFEHGVERAGEYRLKDLVSGRLDSLGFLDWADLDRNGDLLFARKGKLFRAAPHPKREAVYDLASARELADFSGLTFKNVQAPAEALKW